MASRPNILVFCTDQQRADYLGCAGHPLLRTPALDRLAARGIRFTNCFTTYAACMPARGAMLTGLSHRACGMRSNGVPLPPDVPTIGSMLGAAGYRTHSVGKLHLRPWHDPRSVSLQTLETPEDNPERLTYWREGRIKAGPRDYHGFQTTELTLGHVSDMQGDYRVWLDQHFPGAAAAYAQGASDPSKQQFPPQAWSIHAPPESHYNHWIADRAIEFLREQDADVPFFLWCSFPDPHEPFAALAEWSERYPAAPPAAMDGRREGDVPQTLVRARGGPAAFEERAAAYRKKLPEYIRQTYGMISHIDEQIGRVLDALKQFGAEENTLVIFLSDHGDELGDHGLMHKGYWPFDGSVRVPFIIAGAGIADGGRTVDEVVSLIDLVPTLLDFAGVPQPDDPAVNDRYRAQLGHWLNALPGESLRPVLASAQDRPKRRTALVETDDELNPHFDLLQMRVLVTDEFKLCHYSPTNEVFLFDRRLDPAERTNLAQRPDFLPVVQDLLARLLTEVNRTENRRPRRFSDA